jgi:hypothetical protein
MQPEDRLDALLPTPRQSAPSSAESDPELAPLLDAARQVRALSAAQPDAHFAEALRARMLTRAAEIRLARPISLPAARDPRRPLRQAVRFSTSIPMRRPLVAAAVLVVALGTGTLTAAAAAPPGSPLFGLHRAEQSLRAAATSDASAKAQLHLGYARQWLAAVRVAATRQQGSNTYLSALQALREEDGAAATAIAAISDGATRRALAGQLARLRAEEGATLGAALANIGWPERIATTQALGALGVSVPRITSAQLEVRGESWHITITGSGFLPGAVLLVDGQALTVETQLSATQIEAQVPRARSRVLPHTLGVGNPDGTAAASAVTPGSRPTERNEQGTPGSNDKPGSETTPGSGSEGTPSPGDGRNH